MIARDEAPETTAPDATPEDEPGTAKVARPSSEPEAAPREEATGGGAEWLESSQDLLSQFLEDHPSGVPVDDEHPTGAIPLEEYDDAPLPAGPAGAAARAIPEPAVDPGARYTDSQLRRIAFLRSRLAQLGPDPRTLQNLGRVHEEAGDPGAALHYYRICLEVDPSTPYAAERAPQLELEMEQTGGLRPSARTTGAATAIPGAGTGPAARSGDVHTGPATRSATVARTDTRAVDIATRSGGGAATATRTTGARSTGAATQRRRTSRRIQRRRRPSKAIFAGLLALAALYAITAGVLLARYAAPTDRAVGTPGHGAAEVAFSPDGRYLAFVELPAQIDAPGIQWGQWEGGSGTLQIQDVEKRTTVRTIEDARIPPLGPSLSWGGERLAYSTRNGRIAVVDLATGGAEVARTEGSRPSLSPDGTRLAFDRFVRPEGEETSGGARHVFLLDIGSGEERVVDELGGRWPSFSPRGDRIVFEHAGRIYVVPADGGAATAVASGGGDHSPAWVAKGERISWLRREPGSGRERSVIEDRLWVARPDGSDAEELLSFDANDAVALATARWASDGTLVLFSRIVDGRAGLVVHPERGLTPGGLEDRVDLAFRDLEESLTYPVRASAVPGLRGNPVLSPDGRTLAYTVLIDGVPQLRVAPWVDADPR